MYYLNSRYYNAEWGRFVNADDTSILQSTKGELLGHNLFAYCTNDPINHSDDSGYWKLPNWAKVGIGVAAIALGVTAAVLSGGAAIPALITAAQISGSSTVIGAGFGAIANGISALTKGESIRDIGSSMLKGAVDGAADGFMWGGAGVLASKAGYGWRIGKNLQVLYKTPKTKGGALFASKNPKVRVEIDMLHGLHGHWGQGKATQSIHRSLNPFKWGQPK